MNRYDIEDCEFDDWMVMVFYGGEPVTGVVYSLHDNGAIS